LSKPRPRRGKLDQAPALVDLGFVELPAVTDFLQDIQKMAQDTHAFVSELQKERAENKKAIEELERRIKILEGQLENAKQAADLLAALRGQ
jgi:septal ring factor EnvC (AmiA/AmiB activator)